MRNAMLSLTALSLAAFTACQRKEAAPASAAQVPPVEARIIQVKNQPFSASVPITGSLVSKATVEVKAETIGKVVRFPKEEGDRVEAGEAVAWVNDENYQLDLRRAESAVRVIEASLDRVKVQTAYAELELERARKLLASGGITDKELKAADLAERDARAQFAQAQAQLAQAQAEVAMARKRLRDTVIRAPVAGEIQKKHVNPGAYVEAPTAVFSLVDNRRLELESFVASSELGPVRPGQPVKFTVSSFPGNSFEGRVVEMNPAVEGETRSAKVRIQVDNSGGRLKTGMFAEGEILTGITSHAIVIPLAAIYRDDRSSKQSSVFVVDKDRAVRRPVVIGRERESEVEIMSGLTPGEFLIIEQSIELADGVRVRPRS